MKFIRVEIDELEKYEQGFAEVYREAFGEPPYNEIFSQEECSIILKSLVENGHCLLAIEGKRVVGLYGGIPLMQEPKIIPVFKKYRENIDLNSVFYVAEIATHPNFWRRGIGSKITQKSLQLLEREGKYEYVLIRTLNTGAQKIYERNGFKIIAEMTQSVTTKVRENGSWKLQEQERFFLEKHL